MNKHQIVKMLQARIQIRQQEIQIIDRLLETEKDPDLRKLVGIDRMYAKAAINELSICLESINKDE